MWHDLVHMGISPGEKAVRTAAVYGGLLVLLHVAGKRQLAQLNSFDLSSCSCSPTSSRTR